MNKRTVGHPTRLNSQLIEQIGVQIEVAHMSYAQAATLLGVPKSTAMSWQAKGVDASNRRDMSAAERTKQGLPSKQKDRPYLELVDQIERSRVQAVKDLQVMLISHAEDPRNWQAVVKMLGVLDPDRWRETKRTEHTGVDGGPIRTDTVVLTPAEIQARAAALLPVSTTAPAPVWLDDDDDNTV